MRGGDNADFCGKLWRFAGLQIFPPCTGVWRGSETAPLRKKETSQTTRWYYRFYEAANKYLCVTILANMLQQESKEGLQPQRRLYSSAEVAALASITLRQLQNWDERGLVTPRRPDGRNRRYDADDLLRAAFIAQLLAKRLSMIKIRPLLKKCKYAVPLDGFAVTDGKTAWFLEDIGKTMALLVTLRSGAWVVHLSALSGRLGL